MSRARTHDQDELLAQLKQVREENRDLRKALDALRQRRDEAPAGNGATPVALLERIVECLPIGVAIAYGGRLPRVRANAVLRAILGVSASSNLAVGKSGNSSLPFTVHLDGARENAGRLPVEQSCREGTPLSGLCEIRRADGVVAFLQFSAQPWLSQTGAPGGSVAVFLDVTGSSAAGGHRNTPSRVLPPVIRICASCRRIADGKYSWTPLETFLAHEFSIWLTHGLCPACYQHAIATLPPQS